MTASTISIPLVLGEDDESEKHGPEIVMNITWSFRLSKRDTLIVLKALGGRLKPEEVEEAKALGDRLAVLRAAEGRQALAPLERAVAAMETRS